jgi:multiple sugar transport system permease protein
MSTRAARGKKAAKRRRNPPDVVPLHLLGVSRRTVAVLTTICVLFGIFTLAPLAWIIINSTKTQFNIVQSFGFWFAQPFEFVHNLLLLNQNVGDDGTYLDWLRNTVLYAAVGSAGATFLSALCGYAFSRYRFHGQRALFALVMSALLVPIAALALPLYLVYAKVGLINSIWGMILPSMVSPVGVYLMKTFIDASIPRTLIDAARIDGAGEIRIFVRIGVPLMVPGLVTVLLLSIVAVWNNYFLPLIIFSRNSLYPITVGLGDLSGRATSAGSTQIEPLLVTGGFITIVPLIALFLLLQRYWRGGALLGSLTGLRVRRCAGCAIATGPGGRVRLADRAAARPR